MGTLENIEGQMKGAEIAITTTRKIEGIIVTIITVVIVGILERKTPEEIIVQEEGIHTGDDNDKKLIVIFFDVLSLSLLEPRINPPRYCFV